MRTTRSTALYRPEAVSSDWNISIVSNLHFLHVERDFWGLWAITVGRTWTCIYVQVSGGTATEGDIDAAWLIRIFTQITILHDQLVISVRLAESWWRSGRQISDFFGWKIREIFWRLWGNSFGSFQNDKWNSESSQPTCTFKRQCATFPV